MKNIIIIIEDKSILGKSVVSLVSKYIIKTDRLTYKCCHNF